MPGNELVIESCKNRNREHQKTKTKEKDNAKQGKYRVKNSNLILAVPGNPAVHVQWALHYCSVYWDLQADGCHI